MVISNPILGILILNGGGIDWMVDADGVGTLRRDVACNVPTTPHANDKISPKSNSVPSFYPPLKIYRNITWQSIRY